MPVSIETHVPERRRRQAVTTVCCCCSCCCCCCLHTLGSLVGAAMAPGMGKGSSIAMVYYFDEDTGRNIPLTHQPGLSAVVVFWWILSFLVFLCFAYGIFALSGPGGSGAVLAVTGILVLMGFPILQIVSAFLTLLVYAFWNRPDKSFQIRQLGRITLGIVLGTLMGVGVMVLLGGGFAALSGAIR